jgi:hypothetical protein
MSARTMTIDSALLRLVKERDEARELCKRIFWALPTEGGNLDQQAVNEAYCQYLEASRRWKEGDS